MQRSFKSDILSAILLLLSLMLGKSLLIRTNSFTALYFTLRGKWPRPDFRVSPGVPKYNSSGWIYNSVWIEGKWPDTSLRSVRCFLHNHQGDLLGTWNINGAERVFFYRNFILSVTRFRKWQKPCSANLFIRSIGVYGVSANKEYSEGSSQGDFQSRKEYLATYSVRAWLM